MISTILSLFARKGGGQGAAPVPDERVGVRLLVSAEEEEEQVRLVFNFAEEVAQPSMAAALPAEEASEPVGEDLQFRVQLQESFSPGNPVHLILLPTSKKATGSLTHDVDAWLNDRDSEEEEGGSTLTPTKLLSKLAEKMSPGAAGGGNPKPWSIAVPSA